MVENSKENLHENNTKKPEFRINNTNKNSIKTANSPFYVKFIDAIHEKLWFGMIRKKLLYELVKNKNYDNELGLVERGWMLLYSNFAFGSFLI